ncbi:MAG: GDYXXLXY domain-containing protein [Proteobacteria bacterium]|nr:GDYXXLXY domain-containing protein [Pseudomonadota bacterium]
MTRALTFAVGAALALPVLALAALIGEQELRFTDARTVNVPVLGVDPRDLLRGHYLTGRLDWGWEAPPERDATGGLCIQPGDTARPRVRFIEDWAPGDDAEGCRLVIAGRVEKSGPAFVPHSLDSGSTAMRLYVSETRAPELEELIRDRPGAVTVDLAVRRDGSAAVRALRVDGKIPGR